MVEFDEPNLVASAGPVLALAQQAGLHDLADNHLTVPGDKGANAGLKVASLVAGMTAGADSIDDMALLRHGGMRRLFDRPYAPSTLGSFLRSFAFGHVRPNLHPTQTSHHLTTCRETASPRKDETEPSSRPARRLPPTHTIRTQQNHHLKPATPSPSVDPG